MLKFARNKLVTIHQKDPDTLMVHGVLEDDIYGLEVDAEVRLPDLTFVKVTGKWNRWTTPECPRSLLYISGAEGLRIDGDVEKKLQKIVGRKACRHYATVLIECCKSVREAVTIRQWKHVSRTQPDLSFEAFINDPNRIQSDTPPVIETAPPAPTHEPTAAASRITVEPEPTVPLKAPNASDGFIVDLHTHSYPASACSEISVDALIQEAKRIGLDGICLTDHNYLWGPDQLDALRQKHGFLILGGNEVTTDQGHMLVFGLDTAIEKDGLVKLHDLHHAVQTADGYLAVSHPFRGFLTFGVDELGLSVEKASERTLFKSVDAVEVLNGMVTPEENQFALRVSQNLGLPAVGGSDAHNLSKIGCYATQFEKPIYNEKDLLSALKAGTFCPVVFRDGLPEAC